MDDRPGSWEILKGQTLLRARIGSYGEPQSPMIWRDTILKKEFVLKELIFTEIYMYEFLNVCILVEQKQ